MIGEQLVYQTFSDAWEEQRPRVRQLLVGMCRDFELAEDLLQETYLLACKGWSGYKGGNLYAWLAAIARNAFLMHRRKRYLHAEVPLEEQANLPAPATPELLHVVRQAVAALPDALRSAVLMRHYAGLSYRDIAERQQCTVSTAKWRVSSAIGRLREAFEVKEGLSMACRRQTIQLIDFVYHALPASEAAEVERHIADCSECREKVRQLTRLLHSLDAVEGEYKARKLIEIDQQGVPRDYSWSTMANHFGRTMTITWWTLEKGYRVDYAMVQGQLAEVRQLPYSDQQYRYEADLPQPVAPGENYEKLLVFHPEKQEDWAQQVAPARWRYHLGTSPNTDMEWAFLLMIRLPVGARLLSSDPPSTEIRTYSGQPILVWRAFLPRIPDVGLDGRPLQFEATFDYELSMK